MSRAWTSPTPRLRVLFTCRPLAGHFLPMVPLAQALLDAGHEVACASASTLRADAETRGLQFFEVGPDPLSAAQRAAMFPEIRFLAPDEIRSFFFGRVFTGYELPIRAGDLIPVVEEYRPDVLVHEVAELAGPLVASVQKVAYATHGYGLVLGDDGISAAAEGARQHWKAHGLDPHPRAGLWEHLYLDVCPPSLQRGPPAGSPTRQLIRPGERTQRLQRAGRPMVYVTLGTVYNTDIAVFRTILEGIASEPVDVIVTVGSQGDPGALGAQPAHVRVERFVPQRDILPACSVAITHGGAGSTFGALTFGCPMLLVPQGADQFSNAERVVAAGAGLQLVPGDLAPTAVRLAVHRLLHEASFASAAQRISDEIAAMPDPSAGVAALERLADNTAR